MPPERGRASRACAACRRQKTRCYESSIGKACLRCERLGQECSFDVEIHSNGLEDQQARSTDGLLPAARDRLVDERFERLERTIDALARRLEDVESPSLRATETRGSSASHIDAVQPNFTMDHSEQGPAPLILLRDVTTQSGVQPEDRTATNTPTQYLTNDIIRKGLISEQDALSMVTFFQENYGRWVYFSLLTPSATLLESLRKSPLLLCACCLIAVRHSTQALASRLAPVLYKEARTLLSTAMLTVPQPIEFFQASLLLSLWSTTIGQIPLTIDSWLLSGFVLQHSAASPTFLFGYGSIGRSEGKQELDHLCVYNHLCLAHLHYCVGTRRKAVLTQSDIDRCRLILGSDHATNFESRMVAEVHLYWIIYESCNSATDLPKSQSTLHTWKEEWKFLFDQPRSQFVQMGFHFAQLLMFDQALKSRSAAVRESVLSEMIRLSTTIINLAIDTADERTPHLTDHIYHMISFAAVTLCRLLHTYEGQLSSTHDLASLDGQILSLVSWLHAIGLPCHIAYTMGDVVAAFHKKLRPESGPSPSSSYVEVDPAIQGDFAQLFPELFGSPFDATVTTSLLPEYQPII